MELSWRHGLGDFTMPYQLQSMRDQSDKLKKLEKEVRERAQKDSAKEKEEEDAPLSVPVD